MSVASIVQSVDVKAPPGRAFALFTERMTEWWPKGRTPGANPHVALVIEPYAGGRAVVHRLRLSWDRGADGDARSAE